MCVLDLLDLANLHRFVWYIHFFCMPCLVLLRHFVQVKGTTGWSSVVVDNPMSSMDVRVEIQCMPAFPVGVPGWLSYHGTSMDIHI